MSVDNCTTMSVVVVDQYNDCTTMSVLVDQYNDCTNVSISRFNTVVVDQYNDCSTMSVLVDQYSNKPHLQPFTVNRTLIIMATEDLHQYTEMTTVCNEKVQLN